MAALTKPHQRKKERGQADRRRDKIKFIDLRFEREKL